MFYKLTNESLKSILAPGRYSVQYAIGQWAEAPIGGLAVFETLVAAQQFADGPRIPTVAPFHFYDPYIIWEAEGEDPVWGLSAFSWWEPDHIEAVWTGNSAVETTEWPQGTCLFRRVKLVKQVGGHHAD